MAPAIEKVVKIPMPIFDLGIPQFTDEDAAYQGSRFRDVVDALFANPYQRVWGRAGEPPLPVYGVNFATVASQHFRDAASRTVDSGADLRWAPDRKGFRRIVHPNGVCLIGRWQITADTQYSGYFTKGSTALAIARYSTCCTDTCRGQTRSLSLVGKLFPTTDPDHAAPLRTANFMTQDDIGGADTEFINDIELRNAPNTTVARRGLGAPTLVATGLTFNKVTSTPPSVSSTRSPSWANRRESRRAPPSSCVCSCRLINRASPATSSIFAMRSWRRCSTAATRRRSGD
jgi:hypothetical protein